MSQRREDHSGVKSSTVHKKQEENRRRAVIGFATAKYMHVASRLNTSGGNQASLAETTLYTWPRMGELYNCLFRNISYGSVKWKEDKYQGSYAGEVEDQWKRNREWFKQNAIATSPPFMGLQFKFKVTMG